MAKKAEDFESQFKRLEEIVRQLEDGQLPLEESLRVFEEGVKLARSCQDRLGEVERRVEILLRDENGQVRSEPFGAEPVATTEEEE